MPRMGRIVLPNYPHHVVQRGHNRQVVFTGGHRVSRYRRAAVSGGSYFFFFSSCRVMFGLAAVE